MSGRVEYFGNLRREQQEIARREEKRLRRIFDAQPKFSDISFDDWCAKRIEIRGAIQALKFKTFNSGRF